MPRDRHDAPMPHPCAGRTARCSCSTSVLLPARGDMGALRDARAGGGLHPHAGGARRAGDRARGGLRDGAGRRGPAAAAALLRATRPTAVNLGWALDRALAADDPLAFAQQLHHEQLAADRRMAELGAERFEPGDRALTHCNTGALATGGLRHRGRRAARRVGAGPARAGVGGRDPPSITRGAPHRVGAATAPASPSASSPTPPRAG